MSPRLLAPVLTALALCACKRAPSCFGELDRDDLYRMQKAIADGQEPCPHWSRPRLVVDQASVSLDGQVLAPRSSLPSGAARRVDPLYFQLKTNREYWKQLHPSKPFEPQVRATLAGDLDALAGISILTTTAYAGFPRMQVLAGGVAFSAYWAVPGPPSPDEEEQPVTLRVAPDKDERYEWRIDGGPKKLPPSGGISRDLPALLESVGEACQPRPAPCAHIVELRFARGDFMQVATLARALMGSRVFASREPTLRLAGPGSP